MNEEIIKRIRDELTLCYEHLGRKAPESILTISASIQEAICFQTIEQVHECFKRAKDIESIPTQKTLKEAFKNYGEEVLKYRANGSNNDKALEYNNPREAWLPTEDFRKRINLVTAIKNYCGAIGGQMYSQYCETHETTEEIVNNKRFVHWKTPEKAFAFDRPIKEYLRYLYKKYWRSLPIANGYKDEWTLNLGLIPPTTQEFITMLKNEGVI